MMNICDGTEEYDNFELEKDSNLKILYFKRNNSEPLKVSYSFAYI